MLFPAELGMFYPFSLNNAFHSKNCMHACTLIRIFFKLFCIRILRNFEIIEMQIINKIKLKITMHFVFFNKQTQDNLKFILYAYSAKYLKTK